MYIIVMRSTYPELMEQIKAIPCGIMSWTSDDFWPLGHIQVRFGTIHDILLCVPKLDETVCDQLYTYLNLLTASLCKHFYVNCLGQSFKMGTTTE